MATIPRRHVVGTFYGPSGDPYSGGRIRVELSSPGTVLDDQGHEQKVGGFQVVTIGQDGSVEFYLVPNERISPSGTFYRAEVEDSRGNRRRELWRVPDGTGDLDLGAIEVLDSEDVPANYVRQTVVSELPAASADWYRTQMILHQDGEPDQLVVCLRDSSGAYVWVAEASAGV